MVWGTLVIGLLAVIALLVKHTKHSARSRGRAIDSSAYYAVKPLTKTEQAFYRLLTHSLPGHIILAQVDIKRIVRTRRGKHRTNFNRIAQLSLDFVICRQDFSVIAAVELDDRSHDGAKQRARDAKKDEVMKAIDVRLVRFDVRRYPSESDVRESVLGNARNQEDSVDLKSAA